jgi:hypothetical protein
MSLRWCASARHVHTAPEPVPSDIISRALEMKSNNGRMGPRTEGRHYAPHNIATGWEDNIESLRIESVGTPNSNAVAEKNDSGVDGRQRLTPV